MPITPSRFTHLAALGPDDFVDYDEAKEAFAAIHWLRKYHPRREEVYFKVRRNGSPNGRRLTCYVVRPA